MKSFYFWIVTVSLPAFAFQLVDLLNLEEERQVHDFEMSVPVGWYPSQNFSGPEVQGQHFVVGRETVSFLKSPSDRSPVVTQQERVQQSWISTSVGTWKVIQTEYENPFKIRKYVVLATLDKGPLMYSVHANSRERKRALGLVEVALQSLHWPTRSLTSSGFKGKKHYLGFGRAQSGDPSNMHNEVKFDVLHTHDLFTSEKGGAYDGEKLIGNGQATRAAVLRAYDDLEAEMNWRDMYLQYSSSHGHNSGLEVGLSYKEIRDHVLALPAQEKIVFTMACRSGNLIDAFDEAKDDWSYYSSVGRTLFVMASSKRNVDSSTGPGKDTDEPGGPYGSAGSAFGHALWKAIIGYADGYGDGVKDGFLSLEEIRDYTVWKTQKAGNHTPVFTGSYRPELVMASVPSESEVRRIIESTRARFAN